MTILYVAFARQGHDSHRAAIQRGSMDSHPPFSFLNLKIPKYFRDDLFQHAGESKRPPYRYGRAFYKSLCAYLLSFLPALTVPFVPHSQVVCHGAATVWHGHAHRPSRHKRLERLGPRPQEVRSFLLSLIFESLPRPRPCVSFAVPLSDPPTPHPLSLSLQVGALPAVRPQGRAATPQGRMRPRGHQLVCQRPAAHQGQGLAACAAHRVCAGGRRDGLYSGRLAPCRAQHHRHCGRHAKLLQPHQLSHCLAPDRQRAPQALQALAAPSKGGCG